MTSYSQGGVILTEIAFSGAPEEFQVMVMSERMVQCIQ